MTLIDVNVLVNAHRGENDGHSFYRDWLTADGGCARFAPPLRLRLLRP